MMKADFLYETAVGRGIFRFMEKIRAFDIMAKYLHTGLSRHMVPGYIKRNHIDMRPYGVREYRSFAEFFGRTREYTEIEGDNSALIAPCDSRLTVFPVNEDLEIPMKGSLYTIPDLIPDREEAEKFKNGLCLVFRLEASDYHHFCFFDDCSLVRTEYIPGQLHSVQPIALRRFPVFRLNRRWWSILETENFGTAAQIEIGAMAVGGVTFKKASGLAKRGEEMGNFELAGSTIVLLLTEEIRNKLDFCFGEDMSQDEIQVKMGSVLGYIKNDCK